MRWAMQISIFDGTQPFKFTKPIRLIELFGGYGSQAFALKYLGAKFEHWKLCEWAVKSIQAYKDAHFKDDNTNYSKDLTREELVEYLTNKGISANYNEPMEKAQVQRLSEEKLRQIYNNIVATHNLVNICQAHAKDFEIQDTDKYTYVMTYSFPCQDLSLAGKQAGMEKGSGTRSGMLWEVERILDECLTGGQLPQVLLMENVPEVIGTNNIKHFAKWLEKLEKIGYKCYWKVLNAKDFGVPQNRERCFMVSILGDYYYNFPQEKELKIKLKDVLEENVDEKCYLSDSGIKYVLSRTPIGNKPNRANNVIGSDAPRNAGTITTSTTYRGEDNYICTNLTQDQVDEKIYLKKQLCNKLIESGILEENYVINHSYTNGLNGKNPNSRQTLEDYIETTNNISPTLTTRPDVLGVVVKSATKQGYEIAQEGDSVNLAFPNSNTRRGRVGEQVSQTILTNSQIGVVVDEKIKPSVAINFEREKESILNSNKENYQCECENGFQDNKVGLIVSPTLRANNDNTFALTKNLRIRKLTPRECFRLMGVRDEDFDKIAENQSNASLYHLAGDSIVINVLMAIFKEML